MRCSPPPPSRSFPRSGARSARRRAPPSALPELLNVEPEIRSPAHPVALPVPAQRRDRVSQRALRLSRSPEDGGARRRIVPRRAGRDGGRRRAIRRRQEHHVQSAAALLRSDVAARSRIDGVERATPTLDDLCASARPRAAGRGAVRRHGRRQHPLRRARRQPGRGRAGGREGRTRRRVHPRAAAGLRDAARRARRHAVGRPAPAHRHRARDPRRTRRSCCSTRRRARSTRRARRWCSARSSG